MKHTILILHGWGISGEKYHQIQKIFENEGYKVFAPDMPGFGKEPLQKPLMILDDYVAFVQEFIKKHKIEKPIIIGHSFGGRVTAKLAATIPDIAAKIIITGSPLIRKKLSFKKKILSLGVRIGKKTTNLMPQKTQRFLQKVLYYGIKETDYYRAGQLRETFKAIISEDLSSSLPKIQSPTLVLWGENDTMVPVAIGKEIAKKIPNAKLEVIAQASHKLPYELPDLFAKHVLRFL